MSQIGLFFGSFNPIHIGHLVIANVILGISKLDEIWFVVSPKSPFKKSKSLLHDFDRLDMVRAAIHDHLVFRAIDVEFQMPRPSFTYDTLIELKSRYPKKSFKLIIGEDNLSHFHKWKNHIFILEKYGLIVYPRPNSKPTSYLNHINVDFVDAPIMNISASAIRQMILNKMSVRYLVPEPVLKIIENRNLFI